MLSGILIKCVNFSNTPRLKLFFFFLQLQGSLMVAGAIHTFVGATGLVGVLLRFIGPMTIIPAVLLIGLYMIKATAKFVIVHWLVAVM